MIRNSGASNSTASTIWITLRLITQTRTRGLSENNPIATTLWCDEFYNCLSGAVAIRLQNSKSYANILVHAILT